MAGQGDPIARIAAALDRLAPQTEPADWEASAAYFWTGAAIRSVARIEAPKLAQLRAIDRQKDQVTANITRHAAGSASHDMLLWGARGMGKSALIRSAVAQLQSNGDTLALVQASADRIDALPDLFDALRPVKRQFILLIDDLGFGADEHGALRRLRSFLEGGIEPRPANIRLAVTTNQRHIVEREAAEQSGALHERDALDDILALADRFGMSLGFHACSQDDYLAIIAAYADPLGLHWEAADALTWARQRGARSGRTAWQYVTEIAGRAGKKL